MYVVLVQSYHQPIALCTNKHRFSEHTDVELFIIKKYFTQSIITEQCIHIISILLCVYFIIIIIMFDGFLLFQSLQSPFIYHGLCPRGRMMWCFCREECQEPRIWQRWEILRSTPSKLMNFFMFWSARFKAHQGFFHELWSVSFSQAVPGQASRTFVSITSSGQGTAMLCCCGPVWPSGSQTFSVRMSSFESKKIKSCPQPHVNDVLQTISAEISNKTRQIDGLFRFLFSTPYICWSFAHQNRGRALNLNIWTSWITMSGKWICLIYNLIFFCMTLNACG